MELKPILSCDVCQHNHNEFCYRKGVKLNLAFMKPGVAHPKCPLRNKQDLITLTQENKKMYESLKETHMFLDMLQSLHYERPEEFDHVFKKLGNLLKELEGK